MTSREWREVALSEVVDVKHGFAFSGESIREEPPGDILLTPGNFAIGGGFKADKFKYFQGDIPEDYVLNEGDLIVTMTDLSKQSDTLGYPALIPKASCFRFLHNQRLGRVLIHTDAGLAKRYLYYLLCTSDYRNEVLASASGTTVKHTSPSRILAHKVRLPPLPVQKAIADILGSLDGKIELNRRMNETLESMARAIFKSWFIDFDPVVAKSEGRQPDGMDAEPAKLFPSSFVDSEMGKIPKGWKVVPFSETVDILSGGTPKTTVADYWGGDIPWFSVVDAPSDSDVFVMATDKTITKAGVDNSATQVLPIGTTIISARGTVGKVCLVGVPTAMNQSCYGLRGKFGNKGSYTYYCTRFLVETLKSHSHGSVFDTITRSTFDGIRVTTPPNSIILSFEEEVNSLLCKIRNHLSENRFLSAIRDALLPRLLSGKLRLQTEGVRV